MPDNHTDIPRKYTERTPLNPVRWAPILLAVSAFLVAWYFADTERAPAKQFAGTYFGLALGTAMVFWTVFNVREGRIRGRSRHYYRDENPKTYAFLMLFKNIIPAVCCFIVGLFYAFGFPG